ncbi:peptidylprolyl isomerase [Catellatospora bangladeshensis]|uniref:Peptidyl-prolyl cis-trans isomerase n=2 Tax=Saccharothrix algeriensis TaxID=173560 RepID=A0ABS2SCF7_9PSEU|nr:peptidylprolyl isomerase [Saccharothrix algeriensis]MBM7813946.1 peptidyl-prolyl cis-trans isomerase B (cyclophilin B) [Saccharothrix algeriensis]
MRILLAVVLALVMGGGVAQASGDAAAHDPDVTRGPDGPGAGGPTAAGGGDVTRGPCAYTKTPDDPAARPVKLPPDPRRTPARGRVEVLLKTDRGPIPLVLDRAKAPCTVQSFLHLVAKRFYDDTTCHRLTAYPTLKVLQCGDPTGTGERGPGYRFKDELPTDLAPAPNDPTGTRRIYPRGTLAMANAGPDTNGSQFFLVTSDSVLRPDYTVFGSIRPAGLKTLDAIAATGIAPTPDDPAPVDGRPAEPVDISRAKRGR